MTAEERDLGGRLTLLDPAAMTPAQRRFYDAAMAEQYPWSVQAGFQFITEDERLIGPFNAFLRRPEISEIFGELSQAVTQKSSLSPQLREVVTLAVGSAWGSDYEVYAHRILAEGVGITASDAQALAEGRVPEQLGSDAELAFTLVRRLTLDHRVDDELYAQALEAFGEDGLFDIWALAGVYLGVSSILNLFAVPAPQQTTASRPVDREDGGMTLRRVVTGHDGDGRSRVVEDQPIEPITTELMPGFSAYRIWGRDEPPAFPDDGSPSGIETYFTPVGGSRFVVITHPPEGQAPPEDLDTAAAAAELERQMPGVMALTEPDGMHTSDTMDYLMVVRGEATLELDDGEQAVLRAGDLIVQNGTRHAWRNFGTEPCTLVAVSVGADRTTRRR